MTVDGYYIYDDKGESLTMSDRGTHPSYFIAVVNLTNGTLPYPRQYQIYIGSAGSNSGCPNAVVSSMGWDQGDSTAVMTEASAKRLRESVRW
jgi:hypothetical protein